MAFDCVNVPIIPNPVGSDLVVNSIQEDLSAISWLEYSFGKSYRMKEERNGDIYFVPKVYGSKQEYIRLDPNDKVSAYSFLKFNGEDITNFEIRKYGTINNVSIDVIVFANLDIIDNTRDYIFSENLKQDIKDVLKSNEYVTSINSYSEGLDTVWSDYSRPDAKFYTEKYATFAYTISADYDEICYEINNYNNIRCR